MKISTREKVLISVTLAIILIVLYLNLFYKEIHHEIVIMKDQIYRNKESIEAASYSPSQIDELKSQILELERLSNQMLHN